MAESAHDAGGRIGLLDYGQSKQLPTRVRLSLARLILAMEPGTEAADSDLVAACVRDLGLRFEKTDNRLQAAMAAGMFDSRLSHKCACVSGFEAYEGGDMVMWGSLVVGANKHACIMGCGTLGCASRRLTAACRLPWLPACLTPDSHKCAYPSGTKGYDMG